MLSLLPPQVLHLLIGIVSKLFKLLEQEGPKSADEYLTKASMATQLGNY